MAGLNEHVTACGMLSLQDRPFDVIDGLVLTQICYMPMEGLPRDNVTIAELWAFLEETYPDGLTDVFQQKRYRLTGLCADQPRYRDWTVTAYRNDVDNERETQFAACTFLASGIRYVAFRGTDLTLAGWKEDLNMSFMTVPAQLEAVEYVERAAKGNGDVLYFGGHSKGGNLAVYAASHASPGVRERVRRVHSFDGPGVDESTMTCAGYDEISARIESVIPQGSVVGMLLCYHPVYTVVRSNGVGLLQHDAFTWRVEKGAFLTMPDLDMQGRFTDAALRQWIDSMSLDDRKLLSGVIFNIVGATNTQTIDALMSDWQQSTRLMLAAYRALPPDVRRELKRILHGLFSAGASEMLRFLLPRTIRVLVEPIAAPLTGAPGKPSLPETATAPTILPMLLGKPVKSILLRGVSKPEGDQPK